MNYVEAKVKYINIMLVRCDCCIDCPASVKQTTPFYKYNEVIKSKYMQQPVVQNDWPPPVGHEYYGKLALVKASVRSSGHHHQVFIDIKGDADDVMFMMPDKRFQVDISDILKPVHVHNYGDKQIIKNLKVVIDGTPGSGKTTLCRKLCNMWAKGDLEHLGYKLMIFCPLRSEQIFSATTLHDLLCNMYESHDVTYCVNWVEQNNGEGVVFIFDGWDELSGKHKKSSLISKIMSGRMLYNCSVIVTSRTYAYSSLIDMMQEYNMDVHKHINVIGFLPDEVESCIEKSLTKMSKAESLIRELDSRQDVLSLCYIPLVCSMVIYVYEKKNKLPDTLTQLYEEFIIQTIRRYLTTKTGKNQRLVYSLHELPHDISQTFDKLCHFAYEGLSSEPPKMTYSLQEIRSKFDKEFNRDFLGLITSYTFYDEELYQFIHLTIQEFLAAWWICKQNNVVQLFGEYWKKTHFCMCSRFIAGLSGLKDSAYAEYFKELSDLQCRRSVSDVDVFRVPSFYTSIRSLYDSDYLKQDLVMFNSTDYQSINVYSKKYVNMYLLQLIYESQNKVLCNTVAENLTDSSLCFVSKFAYRDMTAFDYSCIFFFLRASSEIIWKHLHLYDSTLVDLVKARSLVIETTHTIPRLAITSTIDICQLEELYVPHNCIGQCCMLSLLQSTTLKVLDVRIDPSQWHNVNIDKYIINNKTLRVLSIKFCYSSLSRILLNKVCYGIAKNEILLSVTLLCRGYGENNRLSLPASVIFRENHSIQSFTTDGISDDVHVAEVNTPLKVLCANRYMPWFTKCTQLQYLRLYSPIDRSTMTPLLPLITYRLEALNVRINDNDAYTILCQHLRRNNSTLKTLILSESRNTSCASQLQHMLSVNTTLRGFKIYCLERSHYKHITTGLKNNSTLEHLCLDIDSYVVYVENCLRANDFYITNLKYLEIDIGGMMPDKFVKMFKKILERNSNLKVFIVNGLSSRYTGSISDLESFWRVVLQHPSLEKCILPESEALLQAHKKIMKLEELQQPSMCPCCNII